MFSIPPQLLRTVLLFSLGSALLLSNALTWYIGQSRQVASLRDAYFERIFWLSFSMSDKATELVDTSNWAGLEIHFSVLKSNPEVVYLFLRGMDDEILYAYDEDVVEKYDPEIITLGCAESRYFGKSRHRWKIPGNTSPGNMNYGSRSY